MSTPKRTPRETWEAIEEQARKDEIDRFASMPRAEVDARLRAMGEDPERVRAEGAALAARLAASRDRLAWQARAATELAAAQSKLEARSGKYAGVPRAALLERLAALRASPRLAQPVAVMFRNRKPEEASEEELAALLEEMEDLEERSE